MLIDTFTFKAGHGWSVETFPNMDSEQTLVYELINYET